jgi:transposase-like protein
LQPGVSIAAVALANQLNANFVRSWIKAYRDQQRAGVLANMGTDHRSEPANCPAPTLAPVTVPVAAAQPSGDIQIEIRRQHTVFQIAWPISQATACAEWLRELLR